MYVYTYIHICMYVCMNVCMYECMYVCICVYIYIYLCISTVNATVSDFCLPSSLEGWPSWGSVNSYHPLVKSEGMSHCINLIPYYAKKSQMDIHNINIYIYIIYIFI